MKPYEETTPAIQLLLENYCQQDPHGLSPKSLYINITKSLQTSRVDKVAELFNVSLSLCELIQEENQDE